MTLPRSANLKTLIHMVRSGCIEQRCVTCLHSHFTLPTLSGVQKQQSTANDVFALSFLGEAESRNYDLSRLLGTFKSPVSYSSEKPGLSAER